MRAENKQKDFRRRAEEREERILVDQQKSKRCRQREAAREKERATR